MPSHFTLGQEKPTGGVLLVQNMVTGRTLVAGSRAIRKRLSDHRRALERGRHWCRALQRDFALAPTMFRVTVAAEGLRSVLAVREAKREFSQRYARQGLLYGRQPPQ